MLPYLHPLLGGAVLLVLGYSAALGLRMRTDRRARAALGARHARVAALAYGLLLASWAGGALSTVWLRSDLEPIGSLHFRVGTIISVLLTGSTLTARWMLRGRPDLREIHPWLGATAVLLAAAQVVTGLQLTP